MKWYWEYNSCTGKRKGITLRSGDKFWTLFWEPYCPYWVDSDGRTWKSAKYQFMVSKVNQPDPKAKERELVRLRNSVAPTISGGEVEVHDLPPLPGRNCAWVLVTHPKTISYHRNYFNKMFAGRTIVQPMSCQFRGTWNSGWDHPLEWESPDLVLKKKEKENDREQHHDQGVLPPRAAAAGGPVKARGECRVYPG